MPVVVVEGGAVVEPVLCRSLQVHRRGCCLVLLMFIVVGELGVRACSDTQECSRGRRKRARLASRACVACTWFVVLVASVRAPAVCFEWHAVLCDADTVPCCAVPCRAVLCRRVLCRAVPVPFRALLCFRAGYTYARGAMLLRVYLGCFIRAHCMAQRGFVWLGFVRALYGMTVPHGVPSYGLVRYGTARHGGHGTAGLFGRS